MIVLDGTIVAVALPAIIADLNLDRTQAQWITSLYAVVFAALLLTAGRLGDRWGRRRMLLIGLVLFVVGSVLAALSGSPGILLLARAVQGVGGAMVLPATLSTVNATFRGADRAAAFGVWGAVMSAAAAIGPLLGGVLTEVGTVGPGPDRDRRPVLLMRLTARSRLASGPRAADEVAGRDKGFRAGAWSETVPGWAIPVRFRSPIADPETRMPGVLRCAGLWGAGGEALVRCRGVMTLGDGAAAS